MVVSGAVAAAVVFVLSVSGVRFEGASLHPMTTTVKHAQHNRIAF
jgi:hypothetical protein